MPQCLFCLKEGEGDAVRFTDEHIFPAALGGNLVVKDGSCDICNHGNSKFEQALAVELTPMRMLLQIPDRYGKVPHTTATIVTPEKTYDGRVKGDGSVIVKPLVTEEKNEKGEREFVHRFLTDSQKEKLRAQAKEKGQQLIEMGPGDPVTAEIHIGGDLMVIGSPEGLQTAAKIAYVGLARLVGVKVAAGDAFREVRQYILEGKPEGVARIFTNKRYLPRQLRLLRRQLFPAQTPNEAIVLRQLLHKTSRQKRSRPCDSITFCSHRICRFGSSTAVLTDGRVGRKTRATMRQHGSCLISRPESRFLRELPISRCVTGV